MVKSWAICPHCGRKHSKESKVKQCARRAGKYPKWTSNKAGGYTRK